MGTNLRTILPYTFLFHLLNPHPFPTHDDIILPTYPIQLFLLPIIYDDAYPQASSLVVYNPSPSSSSSWSTAPPSSSSWSTAPPSSSSKCTSQPAAASGVQLQQAEQEDVRGAIVEEEKEKKGCANFGVFHGWNIPPLAATQPAVSSQDTWQLTSRPEYIVLSREIQ